MEAEKMAAIESTGTSSEIKSNTKNMKSYWGKVFFSSSLEEG